MSENRPVLVGTMVDGTVVGVALADTPKRSDWPDRNVTVELCTSTVTYVPAQSDNQAVVEDVLVWDYWQGMSVPEYDTRTSHDVLAARITELEARIAGLEDVVRRWTGD